MPSKIISRLIFGGLVVCIAGLSLVLAQKANPQAPIEDQDNIEQPAEHVYHRDGILGTNFDLVIRGTSKAKADACEKAVLLEIERLNKILNTRDENSEIRRFMKAPGEFLCSLDLLMLLKACDKYRLSSDGLFNVNVGELSDIWKAAAEAGKMPDEKKLQLAASKTGDKPWKINPLALTVKRLVPLNLKIASIAKGYIIDRAMIIAKSKVPNAKGILLDIGGDIATHVNVPKETWLIDVTNPANPVENAPALCKVNLSGQAIATSGAYARFYKIGEEEYSQIINPKTGNPASEISSATVIAPTAQAADALATTLCLMNPRKAISFINKIDNTEAFIVDSKGNEYRSRNWKDFEIEKVKEEDIPVSSKWLGSGRVLVSLNIKRAPKTRRYKRPYVAVWVETANGVPIKTLSVWGKKSKYHRYLKTWSGHGPRFTQQAAAVTRATRPPGYYTLQWDGTNQAGKQMPPGKYKICVEISREKGRRNEQNGYEKMSAFIECYKKTAQATMPANGESDGATVKFEIGKK